MPSDLPILYLFKVTFFDSLSSDCFGQTELGLNVRGCGREAIVCCQGPERAVLKLCNFNPAILLGSAGWRAAANEAFQVRCGDRFLSSLKRNPCHCFLVCNPTQFFWGGFRFGGFRWCKVTEARRRKNAVCLTQSLERATFHILCSLLLEHYSIPTCKTAYSNLIKDFFLSALVPITGNISPPFFWELKHNECQYHQIYRADIKSVSFKRGSCWYHCLRKCWCCFGTCRPQYKRILHPFRDSLIPAGTILHSNPLNLQLPMQATLIWNDKWTHVIPLTELLSKEIRSYSQYTTRYASFYQFFVYTQHGVTQKWTDLS